MIYFHAHLQINEKWVLPFAKVISDKVDNPETHTHIENVLCGRLQLTNDITRIIRKRFDFSQ